PASLYQVTQGVHVATGLASVPLLLAKLWTVIPRFWQWPPVRDAVHAVERVTLLPLVGGAPFQLFSGVANVALWDPLGFFFTVAHYWMAWITMGALVTHVGAKAAVARRALARPPASLERADGGLTRRGFLASIAAASTTITVATVGQTLRPLRRV